MIGQGPRSEKEQKLPEYAWRELDMARGGYDLHGAKIDNPKIKAVFAKWGIAEDWPHWPDGA